MAKTLAQIQQQIQQLQDQASALKKREASGVIAKIKVAIEAYGLTPEDLFSVVPAVKAKRASKTRKVLIAAPDVKVGRKKAPAKKKTPSPRKFTDGTNSWSGHGKRPQWFKDALEAGKTMQDLVVRLS